MLFSFMDLIEEIKSKIDIIDLISEYVQVRQVGNSFRALCPFHREKTPSFFISPEKQIWHCFGACNEGGDIFKFIMKMENMEFPEALRVLAKRAGVTIDRYNPQAVSQKTKLFDICRWSAEFYHKVFWESPLAEKARNYLLKERKLNKKIINEFQIGFVPDKWDALLKFLTKRGFKEKDIEAAGMIIKSNRGGFYDRFRHRLTFPIADVHDQIVGFTARILPGSEDEKKSPKYINTPDTLIYNKSRILYGLNKAKNKAKKEDFLILVEGNMDVLACYQAGYENVICTSGTALTHDQIKILQRYTSNIVLAFDIDLAGQAATQRSIDMLLQQSLNVNVLRLRKGKDPDEFIRTDLSGWKKAVKEPQPIMEYYFSLAFKDKDLNKIEDKKQISRILLPIIAKLGDSVEQDLWLKKISNDLNVSEISLRDNLRNVSQLKQISDSEEVFSEKISAEQKAGQKFLALILKYPDQAKTLKEVVLEMFLDPRDQAAARKMKDFFIKNKKINLEKIKKEAKDEETKAYFDFLVFLAEKEFENYKLKEIEKELKCLANLLKKKYLNKRMEKLIQELKEAEKGEDKKEIERISQKIVKVSQEINDC
ncbi:MAG: DNA primase [Patescibacteria group bacterium]|nr:DNA primase [Patescibacteria group bacterium]